MNFTQTEKSPKPLASFPAISSPLQAYIYRQPGIFEPVYF